MIAWEWDLTTGRCVRSANVTELLGIGPVSDTGEDFLRMIHPDDQQQVRAVLAAASRDEAPYDLEFRLLIPDGRTIWVADKASPRRGPDGRPTHLAGICVDITERKRAEAALRDADRRKDEFLATLAHELRNPMAPILNAVHILRLHGTDNPQGQWATDVMNRQVQQLSRLVDD